MQKLQQGVQRWLQSQQPQPVGKVFIVTKHFGSMVGYESLFIMHVSHSSLPVFLKQYAGRIIMEGSSKEEVLAKFNAVPIK